MPDADANYQGPHNHRADDYRANTSAHSSTDGDANPSAVSDAHTRPDRIPGHPITNRYTNYSGADVIRRHVQSDPITIDLGTDRRPHHGGANQRTNSGTIKLGTDPVANDRPISESLGFPHQLRPNSLPNLRSHGIASGGDGLDCSHSAAAHRRRQQYHVLHGAVLRHVRHGRRGIPHLRGVVVGSQRRSDHPATMWADGRQLVDQGVSRWSCRRSHC